MQISCSIRLILLLFLCILLFVFLELQRIEYSPSLSANYAFHHFKSLRQARHRHINSTSSIIFLKTHKTGGSTVSGILFRELCSSNSTLNCFIPPSQHAGRIWDLRNVESDSNYILPKSPYDVWIHHVRYSKELFQIMKTPRSDQVILSIVRRPSSRFMSAWSWYKHENQLHMSLNDFVNKHVVNIKKDVVSSKANCRVNPSILSSFILNNWHGFKYRTGLDATAEELTLTTAGVNSLNMLKSSLQWRWFGWMKKHKQSSYNNTDINANANADVSFPNTDYNRLLGDVASGRLFLLVADRMDESLVVLAQHMQWDVSRVLHFNHKVMSKQQKQKQLLLLLHDKAVSSHQSQSSRSSYNNISSYNNSDMDSFLSTDTDAAVIMNVLDECQPFDFTLYLLANQILDEHIQHYSYSYSNSRLQYTSFHRRHQRVQQEQKMSTQTQSWSFQKTLSKFQKAQSKLQVICSCLKTNQHQHQPCFNLSSSSLTNTSANNTNNNSMNKRTKALLQSQQLKVRYRYQRHYKQYRSFMLSYCESLATDNRQTIHHYFQQQQQQQYGMSAGQQQVRNEEEEDIKQNILGQLLFS